MNKRTNLAAALHDAGARPSQPIAAPSEAIAAPSVAPSGSARPPSREGQRAVTTYVSPEAHKQLRLLGVELDNNVQDLMTEAMNDLFQKHGKARIA